MLTFLMTLFKCIPNISFVTGTRWNMIYYSAVRINSASIRTRIPTFILNTRLISRAIWIQYTFRPTDGVGVADEIVWAGADTGAILNVSDGIGTAWVWSAWVGRLIRYDGFIYRLFNVNVQNLALTYVLKLDFHCTY